MAYGGTQLGPPRLVIDPDTGEQNVVYDEIEVSPTTSHQYGPWRGFIAPRRTNIGVFASAAAIAADPFLAGGPAAPAATPGTLPTGLIPGVDPFTPATLAGIPGPA